MIQCPRGTRDFLPDELEKRRFYESVLRGVALSRGFREIQTPMFEEAELFILRSGPNVMRELYAFKDKGDRDIALRPEMTAPVIRAFVNGMSSDPKPIKVFYFGQCFRYERPQAGRYREFFQFGAEIIGSATPETDAEAIRTAYAMLRALGIRGFRMRVGHIGVLRQRIAALGVPLERAAEVLQKLDKKMYDEARALLKGMGAADGDIDSLFELTGTVGGPEVLGGNALGEAGEYLSEVVSILSAMGLEDIDIDLGVVRGLDYYTGMVFEAEAPALGAEKQICGGGSYSLSELFGGETVFSTGFAVGFDRALLALEKEGASYTRKGIDVYIVPASEGARKSCFTILEEFRAAGLSADIDLMGRKMGKALRYAQGVPARFAAIVGDNELASGTVTLRDMSSGEQREVPVKDADRLIRRDRRSPGRPPPILQAV